MTKEEFDSVIVPFLEYYWKKIKYYNLVENYLIPIKVGNFILVCSQCYIPDQLLVLDQNENIIDGFELVPRDTKWNGQRISALIKEINSSTPNGAINDLVISR